jgi:hypothetical protein
MLGSHIRIGSLNVRSIFMESNKNIQKEFASYLRARSLDVDILFACKRYLTFTLNPFFLIIKSALSLSSFLAVPLWCPNIVPLSVSSLVFLWMLLKFSWMSVVLWLLSRMPSIAVKLKYKSR